jgi:hypothetical protein
MAGGSRWVVAGAAVAVLAVVGTTVLVASGDSETTGAAAGSTGDSRARPGADRPGGHRLTLPIQSYEPLAPDRLRLHYTTGVPECHGRLDRAVVKEDDQEVVVVLVLRPPTAPEDQPCPEIALLEDTVVRLASPLADRQVVDGSTGRRVRRGHHDLF